MKVKIRPDSSGQRDKFKYIFFNKKYLQNILFKNKNFIITGGSSINYFLKEILTEPFQERFLQDIKTIYLN
jgi:hypothetical protein